MGNLDDLGGLHSPGIDTLVKAFVRNVQVTPDDEWLGTRVGNKYEWVTWQ